MITRALIAFLLCISLGKAQAAPVVVGAVVTETGMQAPLAAGYRKALVLWQEEVNAGGGLLGRPVELRLLDDGSQAVRSRELYAKLVGEKADLLIGPYGTAATLLALAEAERARRVMVNGAAPARAVLKRSPRYVFQVAAPYAAYATGIVELAQAAGCRGLFISVREELAALEVAQGARELALARGLTVDGPEPYAGGTTDFSAVAGKARAYGAELWLAFGETRDVVELMRTSLEQGYAPPVFFTDAATQPRFLEAAGHWADQVLGTVGYDARLAFGSNREFVKAFRARWAAAPDRAAAEGYAAATVLAAGVRRAGTLESQKLRAALAALEVDTVLGTYKVNPANGEQVGIRPAVVQFVKGRTEVVWPPQIRTAEARIACR